MSNQKYDEQAVIEVVFDYLSEKDETEISAMPVEKLYEDIKVYAGHQQMPHFSQFRRYMISELSLEKGERLTSAKVYEIKNSYMILSKIDEILCEKYKVSIYAGNPIICTIPLPPKEIFDEVTIGYAKENRKSHERGKINMIRSSCAKIKKKNAMLILAVIPEFNPMVFMKNGFIHIQDKNMDLICSRLCVFIKNTPEGRKLAERLKKSYPAS